MLSGKGMQGRRTVKNNNRANQQKSNFARAAHSFVHFFAVVLHDYNVKFPETSQLHVLWRKCRTRSLFWWPLAFLIFSPPLQFFFKTSVALFLVELRWPAAYFLFFSVFLLLYIQICGHDNLSKLNTLDKMDTEKISTFRYRLY